MNPSIRIPLPIQHDVSQLTPTILFNIIQDWADQQPITTIQDVEVRPDASAVDVIPFVLDQVNNATIRFLLIDSLDKYLAKVLKELELEQVAKDLWYQENERFSIDYV